MLNSLHMTQHRPGWLLRNCLEEARWPWRAASQYLLPKGPCRGVQSLGPDSFNERHFLISAVWLHSFMCKIPTRKAVWSLGGVCGYGSFIASWLNFFLIYFSFYFCVCMSSGLQGHMCHGVGTVYGHSYQAFLPAETSCQPKHVSVCNTCM